jgi:ATP-binding cassette subfamily B protein
LPSTPFTHRASLGAVQPGWGLALLATKVTVAVAALLQPWLVAQVIDALTYSRPLRGTIVTLTAVMLTALLAEAGAALAATYYSAGLTRGVRARLVRHVLAGGPSILLRHSAGDLITRLSLDAREPGSLLPAVLGAVVNVAIGIGAVVALWWVHWSIAVAFLLAFPVLIVLLRRFYVDTTRLLGRYRTTQSEISSRLVDAAQGSRTVAVSGTLRQEVDRVTAPVADLSALGRRLWGAQRSVGWQSGLTTVAMQTLVLATAGVALNHGAISPGGLVAAILYSGIALGAVDGLEVLAQAAQGRVGVQRVREILAEPLPAPGRKPLPSSPLGIEFRDVTFRGQGSTGLQGVTLWVSPGERVALVGRSGCGKSLCAQLVGRLARPESGRVLLGGVPVEELAEDELRRRVAYVFERPAKLGSTLAEMVTLGQPGRDIAAAARVAQADRFVHHLPLGWGTPPQQAPLSGGEWQRLGIARAAAAAASVLVLDDATSSLDALTEAAVLDALDRLAAGHTAVVLTHRPGVAARADRVVWLDRGRVRAAGLHRRLWSDPAYRAVFDEQADATAIAVDEAPLSQGVSA